MFSLLCVWVIRHIYFFRGYVYEIVRLATARVPKGSSTLNIEDETVLYALHQRPLNGPLNLENVDGFSLYKVPLNDHLSI
jgi:hypothetical protein